MGRGGHYIRVVGENGELGGRQWISNKQNRKIQEARENQSDLMSQRRMNSKTLQISDSFSLFGKRKGSAPVTPPVTANGTRRDKKITLSREGQKPITMTKISDYVPGDGHYFEDINEVWESKNPERAAELFVQANKGYQIISRGEEVTVRTKVGRDFTIKKGR